MLSEEFCIINSHSAAADRYNANPAGDYINAKNFNKITWLLSQATAGTNTGNATVTLLMATAADGTGATAVAFKYRKKTTGASAVWGAVTEATSSGFTTTANEDTIYEIEIESAKLDDGYNFVALKLTESTNDPVTGCVIAIGREARFQSQTMPDALS